MLIISRHPATIELLRSLGYTGEVISHVTSPEMIRGRIVIGNLPLRLAAEAELVGEVTLDLPPELRGQELGRDELARYYRGIRWYRVQEVEGPGE